MVNLEGWDMRLTLFLITITIIIVVLNIPPFPTIPVSIFHSKENVETVFLLFFVLYGKEGSD